LSERTFKSGYNKASRLSRFLGNVHTHIALFKTFGHKDLKEIFFDVKIVRKAKDILLFKI
jgi:hypothetical protein